ncbi:hypothetical protein HK096_001745, partial [Nowakowskiella sp. JEL0078]
MKLRSEKIPSISETIEFFKILLHNPRSKSYTPACFVAHSFGTTAISWLLHPPKESYSDCLQIVGSVVMIDPITLLVCDSAVVNNFLKRTPTVLLELLMEFFLAREMYIAKTLARHFSWSWNIVFAEELSNIGNPKLWTSESKGEGLYSNQASNLKDDVKQIQKATIVLCSRDRIAPAHKVRRYLEEFNKGVTSKKFYSPIEVVWFEGFGHGETFIKTEPLLKTVKLVEKAANVVKSN